jgi:ABC-type sugar transport system ATPase subunit
MSGSIVLETRGLLKRFGGITPTNDVSIQLEKGARRALIGPNGAGKTTLINLLTGVLEPSAGSIWLDGQDITRLAPHQRVRRGIVRTFQINQLFGELTPLQSLALAVSSRLGVGGGWWKPLGSDPRIAPACKKLLAQFHLADVMNQPVKHLAYGKRRLLGSFWHGSMANAMAQAIGAQKVFPRRQVVSLSGDGGFTMMMGEFITLIQAGLYVKVIVLNNGTLGFVEMEMKANGFLDAGCDLKNPNFAAMAEAMGVKGVRVERPQSLHGALSEAFAHDGPVLVDIVSARQELAMPPKTTLDEAAHFGMFLMKAVLDGRGAQLIDLAKTNLIR